ncbi:hypothetical protein P9D47_21015 [Bacillus haynesii]|uniref:hypothetical protein n=1 Tax=Bacillus haynesii TaxID=1925021 RepID=UPI0015944C54|nr:hypothetical protein [Bacillus haynesii]MEC1470498.1 hypothetical protein [Bacillus haynesii]MEC1479231.1 hypothetical protein [Bacillus haynesii]NVB36084.1 hypothetical protein [Bacillus licheniformis]
MRDFKYALYDTFTEEMDFYKEEENALKDYEKAKEDVSKFCDEDAPEYVYLFEIVKQEEIK